jgi:AhpD family alkylhydroperoxidase
MGSRAVPRKVKKPNKIKEKRATAPAVEFAAGDAAAGDDTKITALKLAPAKLLSSHNRCYYCLVAHGAAVRALSRDPVLGELMAMNYRAARLSKRQRAMLDFAVKVTAEPWAVEEEDRACLRREKFSDRDIWDIAAVAGFFNMSNRVASATDMRPNSVYHRQAR